MIRFGLPAVMVGASALTLAACTATPNYPITEGQPAGRGGVSVSPPRYPINPPEGSQHAAYPPTASPPPFAEDEGAPPKAAPSGSIEEQPLNAPGPIPPGGYPTAGSDLRGRQSEGAPRLPPAPPPALETPREVQVQPFENLYDVAERTRTPIRAIIDANNLRPPYALAPGTVLRIPSPAIYTVAEGDTLFGVARRFGVDPRSLANLNDIPLETRVRPGQRLALPSLVHDRGAIAAANGARPEGLSETVASAAPEASPVKNDWRKTPAASHPFAVEPPPRVETPPASESDIASLGKGKFIWPVRGEILSNFGPKGPGQRNDGLNIAAADGAVVKAAAAGTVVYAGASIPAFGNLVLVKHPGGWATLYGNLGKITVKNNAQVAQGEQVGLAGVSGAVDRPQVHFEIRYAPNPKDKAKPYDPATLLPEG